MSLSRFSLLPVVAAISGLFAGCATYPQLKPFFAGSDPAAPVPASKLEAAPREKPVNFWDDGRATSGAPQIVVKLGEQRAYFYRGKKMIGATRCSTGKKGFATPTGTYRVIQKNKDHRSNLYGDFVGVDGEIVMANVDTSKDRAPEGTTFVGAKMPYFLRFHGGYGLHAGRVPSRPASHGCVRLPADMARHFFTAASVGTQVRVEP